MVKDWIEWECFKCHKVFAIEDAIGAVLGKDRGCATCLVAEVESLWSFADVVKRYVELRIKAEQPTPEQ